MADIVPFEIHLSDEFLETTKLKLRLARLDDGMGEVEWNDLEVGHQKLRDLVQYWRDEYDWRKYESHLNSFHHFKTAVSVQGFDAIDLHFLHHRSDSVNAIPLIFVHGWYDIIPSTVSRQQLMSFRPGSFLESLKMIPLLTNPPNGQQAFHVVAPSIPGYGFSGYSRKAGFGLSQHAECFANLMKKLGYEKYMCQVGTLTILC